MALTGVACAAVLMAGQVASATMINDIGFTQITSNGSSPAVGADQLQVDIFNNEGGAGANQVLFKFFNNGPTDATIARIYFDDDVPPVLAEPSVAVGYSNGGISFSQTYPGPGNLPSGNTISFAATYAEGATQPPPQNGVNPGEWVSFLFNLVAGKSFSDLTDRLDDGTFRMGLHVISIGDNEESEAFVNNPPPNGEEPPGETPVPEPTSIMLLALGAVGLGGYARRRSRKQESATP